MINPFAHPVYVMAKPAGPACNLACEYCYYLEKKQLFEADGRFNMSDTTLELFIRQYIAAQTVPEVLFTWHGGEAMLRPLSFYHRVMELQQKYAEGRLIYNALQTNGTLLNDEWCRFLRQNGWLVGVSIDGPAEFHDEYRRNAAGKPSHQQVLRGIRLLQRHGVEWNALAVVNDYNADYPREFYRFFRSIDCRYIQFTPVVERVTRTDRLATGADPTATLTPWSVTPQQWGDFLIGVFNEWVRSDVGKVYVQLFDATLANLVGETPGVCTMAPACGHAAAIEHNGDLYSCDHFVFPEHRLGNIHERTILEMMMSEQQQLFGTSKRTALPDQCHQCEFLQLCNGECPRNRFCTTAAGQPGLNYLCEGYRRFFQATLPAFRFMAAELAAERPPANVMLHPELFPE